MIAWAIAAGAAAGAILGFLGAGGTVVGLPVLLYLAHLAPHRALGTNALGVAAVAATLLGWRLARRQVALAAAVAFTVPGVAGDLLGARLGLATPGHRLIAILGLLLFVVAAWLAFQSTRDDPIAIGPRASGAAGALPRVRLLGLAGVGIAVGLVAGFFAIGGGFLIVPALALVGGLDLLEAAAAGLLPIAAFAACAGAQYWAAGAVDRHALAAMILPGLIAGIAGSALARRIPRRALQRVFAAVLVLLGAYMIFAA